MSMLLDLGSKAAWDYVRGFPRLFDQSSAIELPVRCLWSNLASNSVSSSPVFCRAPGELRFLAQDGVNRQRPLGSGLV
jgi:hypothetical protein